MAETSEAEGFTNEERASGSPGLSSPRGGMTSKPRNDDVAAVGGGDSTGPSPHKMRSPRGLGSGVDTQSTDTKSSGVSGESESHGHSVVSVSPKHKDPDRIKKDREREERVRQARERLEEERKKKLVELQEQQRQAQENREKQLEIRRKKIEDLRRRDIERRAAVEERRRVQEETERSRRETLLLKAEERVARYEAWKRGGQKGPPPGGMPAAKHLSVSTSVLYHKRTPEFAAAGVLNPSARPDSLIALNTIPEGRRSVLAPTGPPPSRPKSVMTLSASSAGSTSSSTGGGGVKLRENKSPRKPRPASVATSMPSFMSPEAPRDSPRSKSTDRLARERSKTRGSQSARRADNKGAEKQEEKKVGDKSAARMNRRTIDRLSLPKQSPTAASDGKEATPPRRESPITRKPSVKEKSSDKAAKETAKDSPVRPHHPHATSTTTTTTTTTTPTAPGVAPATSTPGAAACGSPSTPGSRTPSRTPTRVQSPTPGEAEDGGSASARGTPTTGEKSSADITAEEYKAKLAEKRRQAREKAEREAEEERKRQEEIQRQEEERRRQEEEEQRCQEEEALRLAEEARQAEEERLRKAIEAEEQRKAEEAARLEQERLAKEEAERKAREEAERLELERQEKARKEEEERQERKKRLEMIMKRVKTDSPAEPKEAASKSLTNSPTKSVASAASSDVSPTEPEGKDAVTTFALPAAQAAEAEEGGSAGEEQSRGVADGSGSLSPVAAASPVPPPPEDALPPGNVMEAWPAPKESDVSVASLAPVESESKPASVAPETDQPDSAPANIPPSLPSSAAKPIEAAAVAENGGDRPKFKSPLLQKLVEGKDDAGGSSGGPRFKSPLLQNILGKTKVGARMGFGQDHSVSTPDLSPRARNGQGSGEPGMSDTMSTSMVDVGAGDSSSYKEAQNVGEEKEVDTSEDSSSTHSSPSHTKSPDTISNGVDIASPRDMNSSAVVPSQEDVKSGQAMEVSSLDPFASPVVMATSAASFWSEQDSGASFGSDDLRPAAPPSPLQVSLNGHGPTSDMGKVPLQGGLGMEDSSISMRSVGSSVISSSITDSATGSVFSSISSLPQGQGHSTGDREFEELIDLSVSNKPPNTSFSDTASTLTSIENTDDLVNFNKFEDGAEETTPAVPPPIIGFEDANTIRRQDVTDLLS